MGGSRLEAFEDMLSSAVLWKQKELLCDYGLGEMLLWKVTKYVGWSFPRSMGPCQ